MDILVTKMELVKEILSIENSDFLNKVAAYVRKERTDFWNELSQVQQEEIKKGIAELDEGKRIPFEKVLKKIS